MNIEFRALESVSEEYYHICLFKGKKCFYGYDLIRLLNIGYDEYNTLMCSYGAITKDYKGLLFYNKEKATNFVKHLNEKYLIMIILSEQI